MRGCGRHLNPGTSSKIATDGPFEAILGKPPRYGIPEGDGETRSSIEPVGRPFLTRLVFCGKQPNRVSRACVHMYALSGN